ncbi:excalibur calcium-binding domain-containing protein [Glaesserella parasuis]|uniref:excalibur calcium-binding domain-containing protein n=1 Tax=Glaesserella parasuis TaxID=738 RepID=UPI0003AC59F0|nr:excalibur calcium-binding domain-containing protein [Glaesserella parasuis]ATW43454.1 hypothetical protein A2U20_06440 [Glaesserella parasuis D74]EQA10938.1 hypothetical protein HPSD74_0640 [Glaesserella parasuis D74]MDP0316817.1 excalibur calcium-binding domain-containing protein [Glaesserella parasuis]
MKRFFLVCLLGLATATTASAFSCSDGRYCKDMSSCEQAQYLLKQCGMKNLDRDGDGIPCENVCGKGGSKAKGGKAKKATLFSKSSKSKSTLFSSTKKKGKK